MLFSRNHFNFSPKLPVLICEFQSDNTQDRLGGFIFVNEMVANNGMFGLGGLNLLKLLLLFNAAIASTVLTAA